MLNGGSTVAALVAGTLAAAAAASADAEAIVAAPVAAAVKAAAAPPAPPPAANVLCARALYDFESEDKTHLQFTEGALIGIIKNESSEWWYGELDGTMLADKRGHSRE